MTARDDAPSILVPSCPWHDKPHEHGLSAHGPMGAYRTEWCIHHPKDRITVVASGPDGSRHFA